MKASKAAAMSGRDKIILAVLAAAQFMLIVDVVVVNVALPTVRVALGIAEGQLALTAVAYTVTFGSLLIASGRMGDAVGRRRMFVSGISTFTAASLVTGLAQDSWQFFAARAGQGVGAAMVSANALALLLSRFESTSARNKAMGVWGAVGSGGAIAGQVLGGVVVDTVGWRWIFLLNVPLGLVAALVAAKYLDESRAGSSSVDLSGSLLLVSGLAPAVLALAWLPGRGLDPVVLTSATMGLLVLGAFAVQQRTSGAPLVPRHLLTTPGVLPGNAVIALSSATVTASLFFTTLYMQVVLGHSALTVGLAFAPITVLIMGLSPLTAKLVSRMGARVPLVTGLAVGAGGMLLLSRMAANGSYWTHVLPALLAIAVGSALTYVPTYIAATAHVGADDQGAASGLVSTSQELGPTVGLAGIAALAASFAAGQVPAELVEGYRAGLVAAAALTFAGVIAASQVPRDLGRATEHASDVEADDLVTEEAALAQ
jgi:MFS family permease